MVSPGEVTRLLNSMAAGHAQAGAELWPLVYGELRELANRYCQAERGDNTLEPTALVHEAYLRLAGGDVGWQSRGHFFSVAARAMRRILIDHARRRQALKRGGDANRLALHDGVEPAVLQDAQLLALDESLTQLAALDTKLAQLVELRFFAGLTFDDAAGILDVSPRTAKRMWKMARGWLYQQISGGAQE